MKQPNVACERIDKFLHVVINDECWKCVSKRFKYLALDILAWWMRARFPTKIEQV